MTKLPIPVVSECLALVKLFAQIKYIFPAPIIPPLSFKPRRSCTKTTFRSVIIESISVDKN